MTRHVGHRIHGHIEVYGLAQSIPEALALEAALKNVPVASAFQPVADSATNVAEIPTIPEGHPAIADADDNTGGLKAGEVGREHGE